MGNKSAKDVSRASQLSEFELTTVAQIISICQLKRYISFSTANRWIYLYNTNPYLLYNEVQPYAFVLWL